MIVRTCAWCRGSIEPTARKDAKYCSKRCRQASHRFTRDSSPSSTRTTRRTGPMRFAYADPPYPGMSARYYSDHPDFAGEVDHAELVAHLTEPCRYDGWALSTSAAALPSVLSLFAGTDVRVAAWMRGHRPHQNPRGPVSSWEPVVFAGGRDGTLRPDSLVYHARPRLTDPNRVIGAKPAKFASWLFQLLGATAGDELVDLFPGSGGITRAWDIYTSPRGWDDASAVATDDASPGDRLTTRRADPEQRHVAPDVELDASLVDEEYSHDGSVARVLCDAFEGVPAP